MGEQKNGEKIDGEGMNPRHFQRDRMRALSRSGPVSKKKRRGRPWRQKRPKWRKRRQGGKQSIEGVKQGGIA